VRLSALVFGPLLIDAVILGVNAEASGWGNVLLVLTTLSAVVFVSAILGTYRFLWSTAWTLRLTNKMRGVSQRRVGDRRRSNPPVPDCPTRSIIGGQRPQALAGRPDDSGISTLVTGAQLSRS